MILPSLGRWDDKHTHCFTWERILLRGYKRTPLCRVRYRKSFMTWHDVFWMNRRLGGHFTVHMPWKRHWMTVYGFNAMHCAINIRLKCFYFCFHPTMRWYYGKAWPWYLYLSRNATPWAAIWGIGPGFHGSDRKRANRRRHLLKVLKE